MSVATLSSETPALATTSKFQRRRWTVAEFEELVRKGVLREGGPEFLWDGEIISPMTENERHANALDNLLDALKDRIGRYNWTVRGDHSLGMREGYLPSPDAVVLAGPRSSYRGRRPTTADAALVVEVADTSYGDDSRAMLHEYARAGVVQYWIVHIPARRVEVYRNPQVVDDVGVYDPPTLFELDASVPLNLRPGPNLAEVWFEPIPVRVLLCDSLETNP